EQLVFDEERDDLGQANSLLLPVGEPSHVLALDQRLANGGLDVAQDTGSMADERHRLPGGEEGLDQLYGIWVFCQVPHRAVAARIEDSVVVLLFHAFEAHRLVELAFRVRVLLEASGDIGLEAGILALGIEWRTTAFGRCEGDLRTHGLKFIVGRGQFFQPEPGLAASVAELVVGGQNHQDFHGRLLCSTSDMANLSVSPAPPSGGVQKPYRLDCAGAGRSLRWRADRLACDTTHRAQSGHSYSLNWACSRIVGGRAASPI